MNIMLKYGCHSWLSLNRMTYFCPPCPFPFQHLRLNGRAQIQTRRDGHDELHLRGRRPVLDPMVELFGTLLLFFSSLASSLFPFLIISGRLFFLFFLQRLNKIRDALTPEERQQWIDQGREGDEHPDFRYPQ